MLKQALKDVTVVGAVAVTLVLGGLVAAGKFQAGRATGICSFAVMLALHSYETGKRARNYQQATTRVMIGLQKTGTAFRAGKQGEAAQDAIECLEDVVSDLTGPGAEGALDGREG